MFGIDKLMQHSLRTDVYTWIRNGKFVWRTCKRDQKNYIATLYWLEYAAQARKLMLRFTAYGLGCVPLHICYSRPLDATGSHAMYVLPHCQGGSVNDIDMYLYAWAF